ncbi:c-type cytochrome [Desulfuromonas versatilis]|uniref:C-type cytochrome n=1 Tax=Desulfuromonas versatilis TaxID=2802975 RepID=A0ABM8HSZ9_9BACT|nr:c-type cytochrome [Desulfuromonas versatilis]BCR05084.1 c-type cytochrome [Desulfuromonas versatilis]
MKTPPDIPRWINPLLVLAALALLTVVVAALALERRGGHHPDRQIADITVNLAGSTVREHCTTCHPGGALHPAHDQAGNDSARKHPDIAPHSIDTLGCTGCHLGEGMAMDQVLSHGLPGGLGARQVLKGKQLQASCFTCHPVAPLAGAEKAWQGYQLFLSRACDSCHHIAGLQQGGRFGPDLSTIGSHLSLERIIEAIREPDADPVNTIMPRYPLSRGQTEKIAYFLKSRVAEPKFATPMQIQAGLVSLPPWQQVLAEEIPAEATPLARNRCLACHQFGETDGRIAPDLTSIGALRSADYLKTYLAEPNRLVPGSTMPRVQFEEAQSKELLGFLAAQKGELAHQPDPKQLYMHLCQRCHAAAGDGRGLIQPNLANFPRAFAGNAEFFRSVPDPRIVESVRKGVAGTSMPPYEYLLKPQAIEAVIDLIYNAFVGVARDDKSTFAPLPEKPESLLSQDETDELFDRRCSACHGRAGTGRGPRHLEFLPRPRNLTNTPYFAALPNGRIARAIYDGVPGTGMASFRNELGAQELWSLVYRVREFSQTSNMDGKR